MLGTASGVRRFEHTMNAIAAHFGVHYTTVSRLVKAYEVDQKV